MDYNNYTNNEKGETLIILAISWLGGLALIGIGYLLRNVLFIFVGAILWAIICITAIIDLFIGILTLFEEVFPITNALLDSGFREIPPMTAWYIFVFFVVFGLFILTLSVLVKNINDESSNSSSVISSYKERIPSVSKERILNKYENEMKEKVAVNIQRFKKGELTEEEVNSANEKMLLAWLKYHCLDDKTVEYYWNNLFKAMTMIHQK